VRWASVSHAEVSQVRKPNGGSNVSWRTACVAWQKPDVEKTPKTYQALIFGYLFIKGKGKKRKNILKLVTDMYFNSCRLS
jgi:hypothetical protein